MLRKAYENGVLLAGISAGANCWFEQCVTDSATPELSALACLGILRGSCCPHYDGELLRRPSYQRLIKTGQIVDGIAFDDGAAAHYIDGELIRIVSSRPNARAYKLRRAGDAAGEQSLETRYLGASTKADHLTAVTSTHDSGHYQYAAAALRLACRAGLALAGRAVGPAKPHICGETKHAQNYLCINPSHSAGHFISIQSNQPSARPRAGGPSDVPAGEDAKVTRVIDGETIEVTINGAPFTVRYLGIDAPNASECYTGQARTANFNLVNGKRVVLEKDATNADAEGRLLRYVYLLDGRMAQEELAKKWRYAGSDCPAQY